LEKCDALEVEKCHTTNHRDYCKGSKLGRGLGAFRPKTQWSVHKFSVLMKRSHVNNVLFTDVQLCEMLV
jgi:hypothetical protein